MPRSRAANPEQARTIRSLTHDGHGAASIYRELDRLGLLTEPHPNISKRTVERMVADLQPQDDSGPWSFAGSDPAEAALIADVVSSTFFRTDGRVWPSRDMARWIARLRTAWPGIPARWAWVLARTYRPVITKEQPTRCLDLLVLSKPWESPEPGGKIWGVVDRCFHDLGDHYFFDGWEDLLVEFDDRPDMESNEPIERFTVIPDDSG